MGASAGGAVRRRGALAAQAVAASGAEALAVAVAVSAEGGADSAAGNLYNSGVFIS